MAQLEAFALGGYTLEMYPEDHSPPHFHIIEDDWKKGLKKKKAGEKNEEEDKDRKKTKEVKDNGSSTSKKK